MTARTRTDAIVLLAAAAVCIAVAPWLLGAREAESEALRRNRRRIASMTQFERDRLQREFARYQALPEAERERLRRMHAALEEDAAEGGKLRETLAAYRGWLARLDDPWEREELRQIDDPHERVRRVRRIQAERDRDRSDHHWRRNGRRRGGFSGPRLNSEDLASVMRVLEERAPLSPEERSELEPKEGLSRWVRVLASYVKRRSRRPGSRWLDDETVDAVIEAIGSDEWKRAFRRFESKDFRRIMVASAILGSLEIEAQKAFRERAPSEDQLQELFVELDARERDTLLSLPQDEQKRRLTDLYLREHGGDEFKTLWWVKARLRGGPPPGFRSRFPRRRPGDRGPRGDRDDDARHGRRPPFRRRGDRD